MIAVAEAVVALAAVARDHEARGLERRIVVVGERARRALCQASGA